MAADHGGGGHGDSRESAARAAAHLLGGTPSALRLLRITRWLALTGGALLLATIALTVVSVTGRYALGAPVPGDYELVEIICAVAIFLFFPFTHATDGNISAEFFTSGLSIRWRRVLDTLHDVIFAVVAAMLAWRLSHSLVDKYHTGDMSILIHVPLWWAYCFAVLSMALLTVICVWRVIASVQALKR